MLAFDKRMPESELGGHSSYTVDVRRSGDLPAQTVQDDIVEEVPVALVYNGISHAVMMVTPQDLEDFALGFSLSEGIIESPDELFQCDVRVQQEGVSVELRIHGSRFADLKNRRRSMTGRTGCGLCGTESLQEAIRPVRPVAGRRFNDALVQSAVAKLRAAQPLQAATGASHGAAWCNAEGDLVLVKEDVGRHNALDKLIGALMRKQLDLSEGFALVSSRASYEMVHKSCAVGIGCLVAASAPTSLAIEQAREAGQCLIGFARSGRHVIYHQPGDAQP